MRTVTTIDVTEAVEEIWQRLPVAEQQKLSSQAVNALLRGDLYPTGADQLELAIDLAEAKLPPELISKLTRLEPEIFKAFTEK